MFIYIYRYVYIYIYIDIYIHIIYCTVCVRLDPMIDIWDMNNVLAGWNVCVILKYIMYYRPVTPFFLHQPVDVGVAGGFFPSIFLFKVKTKTNKKRKVSFPPLNGFLHLDDKRHWHVSIATLTICHIDHVPPLLLPCWAVSSQRAHPLTGLFDKPGLRHIKQFSCAHWLYKVSLSFLLDSLFFNQTLQTVLTSTILLCVILTCPHIYKPKHTAETALKWLWDNMLRQNLSPCKNLWRDLSIIM